MNFYGNCSNPNLSQIQLCCGDTFGLFHNPKNKNRLWRFTLTTTKGGDPVREDSLRQQNGEIKHMERAHTHTHKCENYTYIYICLYMEYNIPVPPFGTEKCVLLGVLIHKYVKRAHFNFTLSFGHIFFLAILKWS